MWANICVEKYNKYKGFSHILCVCIRHTDGKSFWVIYSHSLPSYEIREDTALPPPLLKNSGNNNVMCWTCTSQYYIKLVVAVVSSFHIKVRAYDDVPLLCVVSKIILRHVFFYTLTFFCCCKVFCILFSCMISAFYVYVRMEASVISGVMLE